MKKNSVLRDLATGLRFGFTGGGEGVLRTVLSVFGIGLAVALLLLAASIPNLIADRDERKASIAMVDEGSAETSFLASSDFLQFRDAVVFVVSVTAVGDSPAVPPGIEHFPAPGEAYVSPAVWDLMGDADYDLLRPRLGLDRDDVTVIADEGVGSPVDYTVYIGVDDIAEEEAALYDGFGAPVTEREELPLILLVLAVLAVTVLLLPIVLFVAVAARFGGERRDRRLAALRLIGADSRMVHRIAAGESLVGALGGLVFGAVVFAIARQFASLVSFGGYGFFPEAVVPSWPIALLVLVAVPATSVAATLFALRNVAIEPLGVVRNSEPRRRRLWWRPIPLLLGVGGLVLVITNGMDADGGTVIMFGVGTVLTLLGIACILPWALEFIVARFGGAGTPSWQLAWRRLQMSAGGTGRVINGVAIAVAGGIALQMLFGAAEARFVDFVGDESGPDIGIGAYDVDADVDALTAALQDVEGVEVHSVVASAAVGEMDLSVEDFSMNAVEFILGDCAMLADLGQDPAECADGDVIVVSDEYSTTSGADLLVPGTTLGIRPTWDSEPDEAVEWTVPGNVREMEAPADYRGNHWNYALVTPGALAGVEAPIGSYDVGLMKEGDDPDVIEHVRNAVHAVGAEWSVNEYASFETDETFAKLRTGILAGVIATMILIGLSLLVSTLEQLQDRRRLISSLVAFGTRKSTLCLSVLWQTLIPVFSGLALALGAGAGLGALVTMSVDEPVTFVWSDVAAVAAAGAVMVAVVTLLSLPALWRMMRPNGLRTE